jgi:ATP-dependent exoDNAse (exonuclease V) beta subunit
VTPVTTRPERILEATGETERTSLLFHPKDSPEAYTSTYDHEKLTPEERRRGEFIHKVLAFIEYAEEAFEDHLGQAIRQASEEMRVEYSPREIREIITAIVHHPETKEFFLRKPEREIRREQEFVDGEGRLFRMDRLVIDRESAVIIDWKTGKDKKAEKEHEAQMRNYLKIVQGVHPGRKLEGAIVYVDLKEVMRIH